MPFLMLFKNRYVLMVGGVVIAIGAAWVHGFFEGKDHGQTKVITKFIQADQESRRGASDVAIEVQNYTDERLDRELCRARIVREHKGCD